MAIPRLAAYPLLSLLIFADCAAADKMPDNLPLNELVESDDKKTEWFKVDLSEKHGNNHWMFSGGPGEVQNGELVLDGRKRIAKALFGRGHDGENDVVGILSARFLIEEPADANAGCGFLRNAPDLPSLYEWIGD